MSLRVRWAWMGAILGMWLVLAWSAEAASGPTLLRRGTAALKKRQYEKAVTYLKQAVVKLPHWGLVHLALAQAMRFRGDDGAAIAPHVKKAASMLSNNPRAQLFAGQFWESQGKGRLAIKHYEKTMALGHPSAEPCKRIARLYMAARQGKKAMGCLNQMRLKGVRFLGLYALLAQARAMSGDRELAAQDWMIAVSRQPNNLHLLQKALVFHRTHIGQQKDEVKRAWKRSIDRLLKRIRSLLPKAKRRNLRMLRPSRNQQK